MFNVKKFKSIEIDGKKYKGGDNIEMVDGKVREIKSNPHKVEGVCKSSDELVKFGEIKLGPEGKYIFYPCSGVAMSWSDLKTATDEVKELNSKLNGE